MFSWACTIHKVQGLTLPKVALVTELRRMRSFEDGQIYVGLSRVTSLENLYILGNLEEKHIKANPLVTAEYVRLRNEANFFDVVHNNNSILVLLNIRGLLPNLVNLVNDKRLSCVPIICLT